MISSSALVNRLKSTTTLVVSEAKENIPDLEGEGVYITYGTIAPKNIPNPLDEVLFENYGENLIQTFDVQIVTSLENFVAIWKTIFVSLNGYNPAPVNYNSAGLIKGEGGKLGISNGYIHWVDRWYISFPTLEIMRS